MSARTRRSSRTGGNPGWTLLAMCLAAGMTFLEITATIGSLTAIQNDLTVPPSTLVWVVSAYTLPVAAFILTASTLGGRYGRKRLLCLGVMVMAMGSLAVATAPDVAVVLVGQAVSGIGAALILPNSIALIAVTFTDLHQRTGALGLWAASSGIGLAIGPIVAGILLRRFDWHAVFLTNIVLGAVALAATVSTVVESRQEGERLDPVGLLLATVAVSGCVYGAIEGGSRGYDDPLVVAAFVASAVATVVFVVVELHVAVPMIQVRFFRSPSFSAVMVVAAIGLFGFTGVTLLIVLLFQRVLGLTQLSTGLRLLPEMIAFIVSSAITAPIVRRTGFTTPLVVGLTVSGLACLTMFRLAPTSGSLSLGTALALFGAGLGFVVAGSTAAALTGVASRHSAMASGLVNTFRQVGAVLGTSVLGTILTSTAAAGLPAALSAHGVTDPGRQQIVLAFSRGSLNGRSLSEAASSALSDAITSGVQAGLLVNAVVFLAAAFLAAAVIRHRPAEEQPATAREDALAAP